MAYIRGYPRRFLPINTSSKLFLILLHCLNGYGLWPVLLWNRVRLLEAATFLLLFDGILRGVRGCQRRAAHALPNFRGVPPSHDPGSRHPLSKQSRRVRVRGVLPHKSDGCACRIFRKWPLKGTKILFCGRGPKLILPLSREDDSLLPL